MPIPVTCSECNANYRVPDEAAGKAIKCKKCGARVPVPAAKPAEQNEFAAAVAGAGAPTDDKPADEKPAGDAKDKAAKSKKKMLIIGGSVLAFLCCCCMPPSGYFGSAYFVGFWPFGGGGGVGVGGGGAVILEKKGTIAKAGEKQDYTVKLEKDKSYVIDMKAPGTQDSFLRLFDPAGKEVASNDDAGNMPNPLDAQIKHRATQSGDYKIQATNGPIFPPGSTISYTLTVKLDTGK
jgi:DNA-directed RNA polymerase subunit RPC12/RpoP